MLLHLPPDIPSCWATLGGLPVTVLDCWGLLVPTHPITSPPTHLEAGFLIQTVLTLVSFVYDTGWRPEWQTPL